MKWALSMFVAAGVLAQTVVHLTPTNTALGVRWVAWADHPPGERWKMEVTTSLYPPDWFTPPGYVDDGVRVSVTVPQHTHGHFFRAKRVRAAWNGFANVSNGSQRENYRRGKAF